MFDTQTLILTAFTALFLAGLALSWCAWVLFRRERGPGGPRPEPASGDGQSRSAPARPKA